MSDHLVDYGTYVLSTGCSVCTEGMNRIRHRGLGYQHSAPAIELMPAGYPAVKEPPPEAPGTLLSVIMSPFIIRAGCSYGY